MITFAPARVDREMLHRYQALFRACFPPSEKFTPNALEWLYADNPDGLVVGYDAIEGERLAAHYVCIPTTIRIDGDHAKALLSLNTATHPDYRGKGLFTRLAERTYEAAAERGFHSVYGVANANSTPGFVRKLGFQLVEPLQARIGIGSLGIHLASAARDAQFQRVWTQDSLGWRCANPANAVRYTQMSDGLGLFAAAYGRILSAYAELPLNAPVPTHAVANRAPSQFRLYLGLAPSSACRPSAYVPIPDRLRPSPLNLIFRPLTQRGSRLEAGHVNFSFLDFDAY